MTKLRRSWAVLVLMLSLPLLYPDSLTAETPAENHNASSGQPAYEQADRELTVADQAREMLANPEDLTAGDWLTEPEEQTSIEPIVDAPKGAEEAINSVGESFEPVLDEGVFTTPADTTLIVVRGDNENEWILTENTGGGGFNVYRARDLGDGIAPEVMAARRFYGEKPMTVYADQSHLYCYSDEGLAAKIDLNKQSVEIMTGESYTADDSSSIEMSILARFHAEDWLAIRQSSWFPKNPASEAEKSGFVSRKQPGSVSSPSFLLTRERNLTEEDRTFAADQAKVFNEVNEVIRRYR